MSIRFKILKNMVIILMVLMSKNIYSFDNSNIYLAPYKTIKIKNENIQKVMFKEVNEKDYKELNLKEENIAHRFDTRYEYLDGTDKELIKNDNNDGWNRYFDLTDGSYVDGATVTNTSWTNQNQYSNILFTLKKQYILNKINIYYRINNKNQKGLSIILLSNDDKDIVYKLSMENIGKYNKITLEFEEVLTDRIKLFLTFEPEGFGNIELGEIEILGKEEKPSFFEIKDVGLGKTYQVKVLTDNIEVEKKVEISKYFEEENFKNSFGVNIHFEKFYPNFEKVEKFMELLDELGVSHVRWYENGGYGKIVNYLKEKDIGFYSLTFNEYSDIVGLGNEPELKKIRPTDVAERLDRVKMERIRDIPIGGPVVMQSSDMYAKEVLKSMGIPLDLYDFHPYVQTTTPIKNGFYKEAPENVEEIYSRHKDVLREIGYEKIPIVASEVGYSSFSGRNWITGISEEKQAIYLVRTMLANLYNGAKQVYWYNFEDKGTNPNDMEHNFGLIKNDGTPKKSYYAYKTLIKEISNYSSIQELNLSSGLSGYELKNNFGEVLWVVFSIDVVERELEINQTINSIVDYLGEKVLNQKKILVGKEPIYIKLEKVNDKRT